MRTASWLAAAVALLLVNAPGLRADDLVLSLHPVAVDGHAVTEPALAGRWGMHDWLFHMALTFEEQQEGGYRVIVSDEAPVDNNPEQGDHQEQEPERCEQEKKQAVFRGRFLRVRQQLFLEITPEGQMDELDFLRIPVYALLRVRLEGDELFLEPLSADWLRDMLEQGKVDMPYERIDDALLLLGSRQELEKLLELYGWDPAAFLETDDLRLVRQETPEPVSERRTP